MFVNRLLAICLFLIIALGVPFANAVSAQGILVAHGGGRSIDKALWVAFKLGGGKRANIVTIRSHEDDGDDGIIGLLRQHGYRNATQVKMNQPDAVARIANADVIFFGGGVQTRLMRKLRRNPEVLNAIHDAYREGAVVGGLSAGAAALSELMICCDRNGKAIESEGIGLIPQVVIDQHYSQREREFRLRQVINRHRNLVGIGIDEDTAVVFRGGEIEVVGARNGKSPQKRFTGCRRIQGIYTCTPTSGNRCFSMPAGVKMGEVYYWDDNPVPRKCVKRMTYGNDANQFATIVRSVDGQISEVRVKLGQRMRLW